MRWGTLDVYQFKYLLTQQSWTRTMAVPRNEHCSVNGPDTAAATPAHVAGDTCIVSLTPTGDWKLDNSNVVLRSTMVARCHSLEKMRTVEVGTRCRLHMSHVDLREWCIAIDAGKDHMSKLSVTSMVSVLKVRLKAPYSLISGYGLPARSSCPRAGANFGFPACLTASSHRSIGHCRAPSGTNAAWIAII